MDYYEKNEIIDKFLQELAGIAKENSNLDFKSKDVNNWIYSNLIHIGVRKEERTVDLRDKPMPNYHGLVINNGVGHPESAFNYWINNFKESNTDVFVQSNWKYFCQFISKDKTARESKNHLKVYIPLDASHIGKGAQMIFEFLEKNNISHMSKIGKAIRFDDIVIRLVNENDMDKLINYVNNNSYLRQGLIKPNPFAYNKDGIAIAVDGSLSYNSTVAGLVSLYIDNKMKTNTLDYVNSDDFYKYVDNIAIREFISKDSNILHDYFDIDNDSKLTNYEQVFSLIIRSHNPNFNYSNLKGHYNACLEYGKRMPKSRIDNLDRLLMETIDAMIRRFNNVDAIYNVETYYLTGQAKYITSNNNLRERITNSTFREDLRTILKQENMDFMTYARMIMSKFRYDPYSAVVKTNERR